MEEMNTSFVPRLNEFTELMRIARNEHIGHMVGFGEQLKSLKSELEYIKKSTALYHPSEGPESLNKDFKSFLDKCEEMEKQFKAFRTIFQNHINDTNFQLGMIASLWGGYIEQKGVEYMLNCLRKEYGVHTWYQKFKRYWHKSRNLELDLLALSDTHAYLIEVKNQLKKDVINQILTNLEKIREHVPEIGRLKIQTIVMCLHTDEEVVNMLSMGNIWIMRYKGFDRDKTQNSWEWVRRDSDFTT